MLEPQYHFAIDVWGAGVVIAEIFEHFCHGPVSKGTSPYAFKSTNCFPISPGKEVLEDDGLPTSKGHLLESIFSFIGSPSRLDQKSISDEMAVSFVKKFEPMSKIDLKERFPGVP